MRGIVPAFWHLEAIEALDALRVSLFYEAQDRRQDGREPEIISDRPMSMELFDAIF